MATHVQNLLAVPEILSSQHTTRAFSTASAYQQNQHTSRDNPAPETAQHKLTHLNSSGEAHMVQIPPPHPPTPTSTSANNTSPNAAHKPVTTRIATAVAHIIFSNPQPYHLINASLHPSEHREQQPTPAAAASMSSATNSAPKSLPKGDVIATSRIAGIMAAKRTADLIPLCHNIPLAGVSVDITLLKPISTPEPQDPKCPHGGIAVSATVTAHAQTGVEMEALTAAMVAGLSVYDMCKAVDRGMSMTGVKVVFKSGGRSGTWRDGVSA